MNCARCGCDVTTVVDSRSFDGGIRRRRKCCACGARFTTYEMKKDDVLDFAMIEFSGEMHKAALSRLGEDFQKKLMRRFSGQNGDGG